MDNQIKNINPTKKQKGFALIEVMAAITLFTILYAGYIKIEQNKIESVRSEVAGQQLNEIAKAANRYIADNYSTLMGVATSTQPVLIRISDLKAANILDSSVSTTNAYGQALCALVLQPSPGKLTGLVVTEGGEEINDIDLATMVGSVGASGGGIYTDTPTALIGARGGWAVNTSPYTNPNQLGETCSGASGNVSLTAGHAAVALWFENNDLTAGFLYREAIPGRPELNRMATNLDMGSNDITNAGAVGATSANVSGNVTSGSVTTGDITANRMVDRNNTGYYVDPASISRTNVSRPNYIEPQATVTENTGCSPNGRIAKDSTGKILSCQSGIWKGNSGNTTLRALNAYWITSEKDSDTVYSCNTGYYVDAIRQYSNGFGNYTSLRCVQP